MVQSERLYYSLVDYFKSRFGHRVQKLAVDAGFTCPNIDGTKGINGCTYCNNSAFNPSYCLPQKSIKQQIEEGIIFHERRYKKAKEYLVYFQAYSNTYAPISELKQKYEEALSFPNVIGLVIGTRPDCVDDKLLDYLSELNIDKFISVEYGIESCYDKTLDLINRKHYFEDSKSAILKTSERGIHIGTHLIFGLPGETRQMMLDEAKIISELPINSIKFHQLQIFKDTEMEKQFISNPDDFYLFTLDEYTDFIINFIELLRPDIAIERFTSEAPPRFLATKPWSMLRTDQIQHLIKKEMEKRNTFQGKKYKISEQKYLF